MQELAIQFPLKGFAPTESDLDTLIEIEDKLQEISGGRFEVDGHDAGSGEMNIFIITDDAIATWETVKAHLPANQPWRAGFRNVDSEDYVPLAPPDLAAFTVQ